MRIERRDWKLKIEWELCWTRDVEGMMQGRGLGREQGCYPDGCRQRSDRSAALRAVPKPKTPPERMHMRSRDYAWIGRRRCFVVFLLSPHWTRSHPATPLGHRVHMRAYEQHCLLKFQLITVVFRHQFHRAFFSTSLGLERNGERMIFGGNFSFVFLLFIRYDWWRFN